MPELPDVETFKRYLDATSLHAPIRGVRAPDERILVDVSKQTLARRLQGASLEAARRHGKHLGAAVSSGGWLMLHFGMTGFLDYAKNADYPPGTKLVLFFDDGYRLAYSDQRLLGHVAWADDFDAFVEAHDLGPDALALAHDPDAFRRVVRAARGGVKSFLMNQSRIAGVGNVYSDETLYHARLHPKTPLDTLNDEQIETLRTALAHVLDLAIERKADPEQIPGTWLLAHREEGGACPRCGAPLVTETINGRTCWLCPVCQPDPT
jgi:formamidopyrimidine-DNA glycosylase